VRYSGQLNLNIIFWSVSCLVAMPCNRGAKAGRDAKIGFPVHPHQLRHALGYYRGEKKVPTRSLAAYMGHKNLNNTAKYAALSSNHFQDWWDD
jgi:integrase